MPHITIDSAKYFYTLSCEKKDSKKTIVYIHGSGGDGSVWDNQLNQSDETFQVVIPDLPGHGNSEGSLLPSAGKYAQWLNGFIEGMELSSFFLVGHSLGSAIALEFARAFSQKVTGLVLTGGGIRFDVLKDYLLLLLKDFKTAVKTSCRSAYSPGTSKILYQQGYDMLIKNGKQTLYNDILVCDQFNSTVWISSIKKPVLVICGHDDKITPCELSRELSRHISGSKMEIIPETGHMPMNEAPEKFNAAVRDFVEKY